jgi:hypothetical protein
MRKMESRIDWGEWAALALAILTSEPDVGEPKNPNLAGLPGFC